MYTERQADRIYALLKGLGGVRNTDFPEAAAPLQGDELLHIVRGGRDMVAPVDAFAPLLREAVSGEYLVVSPGSIACGSAAGEGRVCVLTDTLFSAEVASVTGVDG